MSIVGKFACAKEFSIHGKYKGKRREGFLSNKAPKQMEVEKHFSSGARANCICTYWVNYRDGESMDLQFL